MKIRFAKNDVFDTKGEQDYIDEVAGQVNEVAASPIYLAELTEEEVGYIKQFVDICNDAIAADAQHISANGIEFGLSGSSSFGQGYSAITMTTVLVDDQQ